MMFITKNCGNDTLLLLYKPVLDQMGHIVLKKSIGEFILYHKNKEEIEKHQARPCESITKTVLNLPRSLKDLCF